MRKLQSCYGSFFNQINKHGFKKCLVYYTPGIYTKGYIVFGVFLLVC